MNDSLENDFSPDPLNPVSGLIALLRTTIRLIALPENDFSWSSWPSRHEAEAEIEELIRRLTRGEIPPQNEIAVLFAPSGPLQELSLSSGWARAFTTLATRFDQQEAFIWPKENTRDSHDPRPLR